MSTVEIKPHYLPVARRLKAAVKAHRVNRQDLADKLGVHYGTISNYMTGRAIPSPAALPVLRSQLKLNDETIGMIASLHAAGKGLGPAQRAVALHAARDAHVQVIPPSQPRPSPGNGYDKDPGVFGMRVDEDGTMHLWLRTKLPFEKGSTLLRTLLDFGLVTEKPNHDRLGWIEITPNGILALTPLE